MLRFEPKKTNNRTDEGIDSFLENFDAILSKPIAEQLNAKNLQVHCPNHPDFETVIYVSAEPLSFTVKEICCEEFKEQIHGLLHPQQ